uniref:Uncharacterized protein n=1 Tax=Arundo donax TaxID=35708 RepID=A0A0A9ANP4_ARUDO
MPNAPSGSWSCSWPLSTTISTLDTQWSSGMGLARSPSVCFSPS